MMTTTTDATSSNETDSSTAHIVSQSQDTLHTVPASSDPGLGDDDDDDNDTDTSNDAACIVAITTDTSLVDGTDDTKGGAIIDNPLDGPSPLLDTVDTTTSNDDDDDDTDNSNDQASPVPPPPRFAPFEKVYARDGDGILYVAVVRRRLYGPKYNAQVILGMHTSAEAEAIPDVSAPSWHYFVHYNQWSVRFDRWVSDEDIFVLDDERNKAYAERVVKEHQALQKETGKKKNKKGKPTLSGVEFLREWRRRLDIINDEMGFTSHILANLRKPTATATTNEPDKNESGGVSNPTMTGASIPKPPSRWTKEKTSREHKLRQSGLTTAKRSPSRDIVLPPTFKKELVEQWELVCQCDMLPILPCDISIRQALQEYVDSKKKSVAMLKVDETKHTKEPCAEDSNTIDNDGEASSTTKDNVAAVPSAEGADTPPAEDQNERWRVMADGIARFFDDALPIRLLYKQELVLLDAFEKKSGEFSEKAYSEVFGCGHLLRLFVNLSDILEENLEAEDRRPIVAKLNDFIRYLNKNQGRLLVQRYQNPTKKSTTTASKKRAGGAIKGATAEKVARLEQPPEEELRVDC